MSALPCILLGAAALGFGFLPIIVFHLRAIRHTRAELKRIERLRDYQMQRLFH